MDTQQIPTDQNSMENKVLTQQGGTNNSKLFLVVAMSVLLTAVVTGSATYFWQKSTNQKAINRLEQKITSLEEQISTTKNEGIVPPPTSPSVPSPTPTIDSTANWLTYSNSNIVYTFKYPRNISLTEGNMIQLSLWGPTQKENTEFYDGINLNFSLPFQIGDMSLSDHVDQEIEQSKENADILKPKTNINIGGIEGYTYTAQGLGIFEYIYLQSPDQEWTVKVINGTNDPTNQGYVDTANQILSTFQFTN